MNRLEARNFMYTMARDQFAAATTAVLGAPGVMRYAGIVNKVVIDNEVYWARASMQLVIERQETLRNNVRRFVTTGLHYIQLFAPVTDINAQVNLDVIAPRIRDAYRVCQSGDLEFTKAEIRDNLPPEPSWLKTNIVSQFNYREFI